MGRSAEARGASAHELVIRRTFDAPRALVFAAWTQSAHLARWSGPHGFTTTEERMDLRPGGAYRVCLHAPDGTDHWLQGVYREVVAPERLVFTHAWEDESGNAGPETLVTVTFAERGGKTEMVFHQAVFETQAAREGHEGGWSESFERLAKHLAAVSAGGASARA